MFFLRRDFGRLTKQVRNVHTNDLLVDNLAKVVNKNPRNLELLRIAKKPKGFFLDDLKQEFWHKLIIRKLSRYIVAEVVHFENGVILSVSSKEGGIRKQLYSLTDATAYINVGSIIAKRCLESGIYQVRCDLTVKNSENVNLFLKSVVEFGLVLEEFQTYKHPLPQSYNRPEKPWEVHD